MIRFLLLAALAASAVAAPALGQANDGLAIVRYTDLRLSTVHDIARLDRRIGRAASVACGPTSSVDPAGVDSHTGLSGQMLEQDRPANGDERKPAQNSGIPSEVRPNAPA